MDIGEGQRTFLFVALFLCAPGRVAIHRLLAVNGMEEIDPPYRF